MRLSAHDRRVLAEFENVLRNSDQAWSCGSSIGPPHWNPRWQRDTIPPDRLMGREGGRTGAVEGDR